MSPAPSDRTLVLLRHSKAEHVHGKADPDRELTARGHRDAVAAGAWLARHAPKVDLVVCSTSRRTRQTWDGVRDGGVSAGSVEHRDEVYDADPDELLDVVQATPAEVRCLLLVGHAPGVPGLLEDLVAAGERLPDGFPTSGLAVLRCPGSWADVGPASARLERFHVARGDEGTLLTTARDRRPTHWTGS